MFHSARAQECLSLTSQNTHGLQYYTKGRKLLFFVFFQQKDTPFVPTQNDK